MFSDKRNPPLNIHSLGFNHLSHAVSRFYKILTVDIQEINILNYFILRGNYTSVKRRQ